MNSELVSIVMATYNGKKYLRQQLDSILQQTYYYGHINMVDDASTDETVSILGEYAALDGRIHIFSSEMNLGLVNNFERGLKLAKGDFIGSTNGNIYLIMQIDGNLVLYTSSTSNKCVNIGGKVTGAQDTNALYALRSSANTISKKSIKLYD